MKEFLDATEMLSIFYAFNPWWRGRDYKVPSFKRLAHDICLNYLQDKKSKRAILLSGPRRVGKTTILTQIAKTLIEEGHAPASILYLSLEHPMLKMLNLREILKLYHNVWPEGAPAFLLLDEIQYARDWEIEIKLLVDHQPHYRLLVTGSAAVVHKNQLAESGTGRWRTVPIPTLSFYEFIHIRGETAPSTSHQLIPNKLFKLTAIERLQLAQQLRALLPSFQRYLLVGGFPETACQDDIVSSQRLLREDVVERVLKRDMTALFGIRNINELEKLFIYLCLHTGGILAHKTCADALGVSPSLVANHLTLLEQANLLYRLAPCYLGGKQVLRARNKYYLVDAALRNAVLLRGKEVLTRPDEMGVIVETTVLRHLYAYYYRDTPEILYWRDPVSQKEVDMIVRSPNYHLPFEIKYSNQPKLKEEDGLVAYCQKESIQKAYLVTKQDDDFGTVQVAGLDTQFLKIPAHILCYLLGQAERLLWLSKD